jgi:hypothetical protein
MRRAGLILLAGLVGSHNAYVEGSYGTSYDGTTSTESPAASAPCRPQRLLACP